MIPRSPENCTTMAEVREGVDATDKQLLALLEQRFALMRAAARIKQQRGAVRDEERKQAVIEAARSGAEQRGIPGQLIADIWEMLVEGSIAYELEIWDALRK